MGLQELWFFIIAALFLGFVLLEGFDFGVGMLMAPFGMAGRASGADPEQRRRAALNTIGPVWDANEVWLITAGAAMFAAFPNWYATLFSALYLPLLAILVGMIARVVGIEWRGKIDDPRWRALGRHRNRCSDRGCPPSCGVSPSRSWLQGLPIDADGQAHARDRRCAQRLHASRRAGDGVPVRVLRGGVRGAEDRRAGARRRISLRPRACRCPSSCSPADSGCGRNWRTARTWTWLPAGDRRDRPVDGGGIDVDAPP